MSRTWIFNPGIACPHCGHRSDVKSKCIDSRKSEHSIRRRRICPACAQRFTTYEIAVADIDDHPSTVVALKRMIDGTNREVRDAFQVIFRAIRGETNVSE